MTKPKFIKNGLKKITKSGAFMALVSWLIYAYVRLVWKSGVWRI